jgi:prolyl-tRNA editing enzyme YbaK/EbsC (Cys-tRNA(Pro) deacylase)
VAKLHKESMAKVIQSLSNSTLGKKNFNFRLAPEDVSDQLSGFEHNAVTPIGMKIQIPIILDKPIADLEFIWLGGGEVDVKWGIPIPEFIRIFNPIIAEVSK